MAADKPSEPFDSASALREANRLLLERLDSFGEHDDFPDSFLDEIELFQRRAAATGAYLSAVEDRGEVQSLINFWLTILFNGGRRPSSVLLQPFDSEAARARAGAAPPYKGLDSFQMEDTGCFFGRGATVRAMLDRLGGARLLAVTGLSGSGKSSVVRAGLIPRLREGELPGSRDWLVLDPIVPGRNPLGALGGLLPAEGASSPRLSGPEDLVARLDAAGKPVLVSVDQFEELFTLASEEDRHLVLDSLAAAASEGRYPHVVVITMRSEYDSRVETHPAFSELFAAGRVQIGALTARELRAAIEQPAAQVGVSFEPGLVDELVQRVLGEPAGLPLLQFTLLELWKRRSADNALTWDAYAALGGSPREILARRATEVYDSFKTPQDRTFSHRIFLALAEIGAGLEPTARRVTRAELDRVGSRDNVDHVLRVWQENGLIRISPPGAIVATSQVEVAHEALIRNWDLLVGWIEDHFAQTRRRRVLTEQARAWKEGAHDTLLGELSLAEAETLADLEDVEHDYVAASRKAVDEANARLRRRKQWALAAGVAGILLLGGGVAATGYAVRASQALDVARGDQQRQAKYFAMKQAQANASLVLASRRADLAVAGAREADVRQARARQQELAALASLARSRTLLQRLEAQASVNQRRLETARADIKAELAELSGQRDVAREELEAARAETEAATQALQTVQAQAVAEARTRAQERPAIRLADLTADRVPEVWRQLAEEGMPARIRAEARSVGRLRVRLAGNEFVATAFMISDGVAAALLSKGDGREVAGWEVDFADTPGSDPSRVFAVQNLVGEVGLADLDLRLVLLGMAKRNPSGAALPPPLALAEVTGTGRAAISRLSRDDVQVGMFTPESGRPLYLIGFPMITSEAVVRAALGNAGGIKRVEPGFVLDTRGGQGSTREIRHDATTAGGSMGSPVFDLRTGAVVAIHWGGPPAQGGVNPGKFAVAFDVWMLRQPLLRRLLPGS